jgi:hypothetical protein
MGSGENLKWPEGSFQFSRTRQEIELYSDQELSKKVIDDFDDWLKIRSWKEYRDDSVTDIRKYVYAQINLFVEESINSLEKHPDIALACCRTFFEIIRELREPIDDFSASDADVPLLIRIEGGNCLDMCNYIFEILPLFRHFCTVSEWEGLDFLFNHELDALISTLDNWIAKFPED